MNSETHTAPSVPPKRLWFGTAAAAVVWFVVELLNVGFAWEACRGDMAGRGPFSESGVHILLGILTFGSLALAVVAGLTSYRNWRALSEQPDITTTEARDRQEFMSVVGVFVSATLGLGIVWFAIPIYVLSFCKRPF